MASVARDATTYSSAAVVLLLVGAGGCDAPASRPGAAGDVANDTLVLELGGKGTSLREALARRIARREGAPMPAVTSPQSSPAPAAEAGDGARAPVRADDAVSPRRDQAADALPARVLDGKSDPHPDEAAAAAPARPSPPVAAPPRRTSLRAGQTLYSLAREHLGDGKRWREIAALNGWSEADVASLPAGVEVTLPAK